MRIGIRVDANEIIATGHVMRCLAVAEELKKLGVPPVFISADTFPEFLIRKKGYDFISLQSDWSCLEAELEKLKDVFAQQEVGMLFVDSYYVTKLYFEKLHAWTKVVYIDDLNKDIYDVEAVVCYANYHKKMLFKEGYSAKVRLLLGTDYTPLRTVFSGIPPKRIRAEIRNLIVLSGGTDPYDFLWNFSERVSESNLFETLETINVICGRYYSKYRELKDRFAGNSKIHFYQAVEDIEKYMFSADVAITAAGVTSYELCAAGVPSIVYIVADNQKKNAESFQEDGLMECAGDLRFDPVLDHLLELLNNKFQDWEYRKKMSRMMQSKVDGKGAARIAKELSRMLERGN